MLAGDVVRIDVAAAMVEAEAVTRDASEDNVVVAEPFDAGRTTVTGLALSFTLPMNTTSTAANLHIVSRLSPLGAVSCSTYAAVAAKISWCLADVKMARAKAKRAVKPSMM